MALAAMSPALAARMLFLAPTRLGGLNYYALVFSDLFVKRTGAPRGAAELAGFAGGAALLAVAGPGPGWAAAAAIVLAWLELANAREDRRVLAGAPGHEDTVKMGGGGDQVPSPSSHPALVLNLRGPFVARTPGYDLGALAQGRTVRLELIVANHSPMPMQRGGGVRLRAQGALSLDGLGEAELPALPSGEVARIPVALTAGGGPGGGGLRISASWGDTGAELAVAARVVDAERGRARTASITRYPGACRSAFAWRGDMDLYDTSTFQSIEGLEVTFGLAARYRFPQTMFLSTRLSLSVDEAEEFWGHWGLDRGQAEIPQFIEWMRERVDLRHEAAYPFEPNGRPYVVELGNHGHLHYGTDMAAAPGNGWKPRAKICAGSYPWVTEGADSLTEQRDNGLEATRLTEELFGFPLRSWAMPDRTNDEHTAAALSAAGCEVLSDSDIRNVHNVLYQPPPHHPHDTDAVELTKRYPGDPKHLGHVAMITYWIHRGHRLGIPVVFMCHQHMRQWDGPACGRYTERVLRHVLTGFNGDLHVNTVYGVGRYWNRVLSPRRRVVDVSVEDGVVVVENRGEEPLSDVPVDVTHGGGVATHLVDLDPGERRELRPTDA